MKPSAPHSRILFDKRDHELLGIVTDVLNRDRTLAYTRKTYYPFFHPSGIKELAESKGLRIAYAVVHLLSSLEIGGVDDRLSALRSLHDEILDTAGGILPRNTARVLLEIMKELVRAHGDYRRQLELAHDFRITAAGKPRFVRRQLRRYHLLEMPEEWNQIAFDDHVHDVNTKGRKSSTHLIMDAWIKGIRRLRVIHYNFIEPRFAAELLEAAAIMGIDVRIGIEFSTRFRGKYVQVIWVPRGFPDPQAFLCFLAEDPVMQLMEAGRKVSAYQQAYVMALLREYNRSHRLEIAEVCRISLPPVDESAFLKFAALGQKSKLHLSKFLHQEILTALREYVAALRVHYAGADTERQREIVDEIAALDCLDIEHLVEDTLGPDKNRAIANPNIPAEGLDVPELLRASPCELIQRITRLHSGHRITLNLSNLMVADVLELLYDCEGMITRLEIFNLKDYAAGQTDHLADINELQQALNEGSVITLKRVIRKTIDGLEHAGDTDRPERVRKLTAILHDILYFKSLYEGSSLKARIGSDSTGRSPRVYGMGLAVLETLPPRARKEVAEQAGKTREFIPMTMTAFRRLTFVPYGNNGRFSRFFNRAAALLPVLRWLGYRKIEDWQVQDASIRMKIPGNIVTLGGVQKEITNELYLEPPSRAPRRRRLSWRYLNTRLKNGLKVLIGFIPALATFALTKDWWVLAYGGAFIWFGITGLRNILQSVLGGGGLRRSPLLRWNSYVSWDRLTDSLLYTGFSVPLLDYLVKTVILDRGCDITTTTHPYMLYTIMALANGIYLSSHNALRGFPRAVLVGNFFRSVLSIPIAILFNSAAAAVLAAGGVTGIDAILQKWAAIISKAASDFIAGIIEGLSDRFTNIRLRYRDYRKKLADLLRVYAQLEILFPETGTRDILSRPGRLAARDNAEARDLEKIIMIHVLDMLYFWMYQPRARTALLRLIETISEEERQILVISQFALDRNREISQMFIDGVLGKDFARALSFYLSRSPEYLEVMKRLAD
ncbi:MAG: hypothetical protein WAL90_13930 [Desulfobacterales bacterium]